MSTTTTRQLLSQADWPLIPAGYYAVPIKGWDLISSEDDAETWRPPLLGHQTFRRSVARTCKTGRVIGRDAFTRGVAWTNPEADPQDIADSCISWTLEEDDITVHWIMADVNGPDTFRAIYGKITGRCGHCHRRLTDPKSKLLGIGPECRGFR